MQELCAGLETSDSRHRRGEGSRRLRPTDACAPWLCAARARSDRLWSPCGRESRDAACGRASRVDRCVSRGVSWLDRAGADASGAILKLRVCGLIGHPLLSINPSGKASYRASEPASPDVRHPLALHDRSRHLTIFRVRLQGVVAMHKSQLIIQSSLHRRAPCLVLPVLQECQIDKVRQQARSASHQVTQHHNGATDRSFRSSP